MGARTPPTPLAIAIVQLDSLIPNRLPVRGRRFGVRVALLALCAMAALTVLPPALARAANFVPGVVIVGYEPGPTATVAQDFTRRMGAQTAGSVAPSQVVLHLRRGASVTAAVARLRHEPGVAYAVPDYVAHEAGGWYPDDPGRSGRPGGWVKMQWNLLPGTGVDAPVAWANLLADHRPGGRGVIVAVLDTGVAYRNWEQFRKMPDFNRTRFVDPYDFVAGDGFPLDRNGHGTFVAAEIAESTNNGIGLAGLAYGASIMPVRVLDASGDGDAVTISRGIRYAVNHGARVINLSLVFDNSVRAADIPGIISALTYAHRHGVVVVAAAGNEGVNQLAYPAADSTVISVGATTLDRCLADYSNSGPGLNLVAPGGGDDAALPSDPECSTNPFLNLPSIHQMTLADPPFSFTKFGYPGGIYGTSMAAPEVAATAALVVASGVLGPHPSPDAILRRLEQTAQPLGGGAPNADYGYGMVDAGAATAPIGSAPSSPGT